MASRGGRKAALESAARDLVSAFIGDAHGEKGSDDEDETPNMCVSHLMDQFGSSFPTEKNTPEATQEKLDNVVEKLEADRAVRKARIVRKTAESILGMDADCENLQSRTSWKMVHVILGLAVRPCETVSNLGIGEILPTSEYVLNEDYPSSEEDEVEPVKTQRPARRATSTYSFDSGDPFANVRVPMEELSDWSSGDEEESSSNELCASTDEGFFATSSEEPSPEPKILLASEKHAMRVRVSVAALERKGQRDYQNLLMRASRVYSIAERENNHLACHNLHFGVINDTTAVRDVVLAFMWPVYKKGWVFDEDVGGIHARMDLAIENVTPETFRAMAGTLAPSLQVARDLREQAEEMASIKRAGRCVLAFRMEVLSMLREFDVQALSCYSATELTLLGVRDNLQPWITVLKFIGRVEKAVVNCEKGHQVIDFNSLWRKLTLETAPWRKAVLQRLLLASFEPYVAMLDTWVSRGYVTDAAEEFPVERTEVDVKSPDYWQQGVRKRPNARVPNFLDCDEAVELSCAGRSRTFIRALIEAKESVGWRARNGNAAINPSSACCGVAGESVKRRRLVFARNWKELRDSVIPSDQGKGTVPSTSVPDFFQFSGLVSKAVATPFSSLRSSLAQEVITRLSRDFHVIAFSKTVPGVLLFQDILVNDMLFELFRDCNDRLDFNEAELNRALQSALLSSPDRAAVASIFTVQFSLDDAMWDEIQETGDRLAIIDAFCIEVGMEWPLSDLLRPEHLELYKRFSKQLLRVRYVKERLCRLKPRTLSTFVNRGRHKRDLLVEIRMTAMTFIGRVEFILWHAINKAYEAFCRGLTGERIECYDDLVSHHADFVERLQASNFLSDFCVGAPLVLALKQLYSKCMRVADAWEDRIHFIEFTIPELKKTLKQVRHILARCFLYLESYQRQHEFDPATRDYFAAAFGDLRSWKAWRR